MRVVHLLSTDRSRIFASSDICIACSDILVLHPSSEALIAHLMLFRLGLHILG